MNEPRVAAATDDVPIDVEALYRRYGPMVLRRCRAVLHDEDRARDATQEVFVRLLSSRTRLHGRYPSSLLYRMATNVSLNELRAHKRRRWHADSDRIAQSPSAECLEERLFERDLLERVFAGEQQSTVRMALLHHGQEHSLEETAGLVGLSVSGVRKRLRGLRRRAQAVLAK
jgi:RNA polymerase sigma-70 factor (ECF subfamily)